MPGRPRPSRDIFGTRLAHEPPRGQSKIPPCAELSQSPLTDSNRRPLPYHGSALPTELRGRSAKDSNRVRSRPMGVSIRLVEQRDADALRAIYNREVLESTVTFDMVPRTLEEQRDWIGEHSGAHPALVAEAEDATIVGFGSL